MYVALFVAFSILYPIYLYLARVYFSPIRHIPGPRLAIWTFWYEFYYDVILRGRYTFYLPALHAKYGPIVRINPYEVHISDPDFYDTLYVPAGKRRTNAWSWSVTMFGTPDSILATVDHDVHRRRRGAYSGFFSKGRIRELSSVVVQGCMDKLCERITQYSQQGKKKINLMHAWTAFTGDVVTTYCFPESYGLLDKPDFAPEYYEFWMSLVGTSHMLKQFPWLFPLMLSFPNWFVERYLPDLAVTYRWHRTWTQQIEDIKARKGRQEDGKLSIFETLLESDLPPQDKTVHRLMQDAQTLVGAASITTSIALTLASYYILETAGVQDKLVSELRTAMPNESDVRPLVELEKLEYLSAVVLEALRISYGVSHRLQRVFPNQAIKYDDYVLPPGTPISMTSVLIHDHSDIFPEPRAFRPERWLPLDTTGAKLQKYMVAFSRGSRQCLGMHLGEAELYIGLATMFRRFGGKLKVVDTDQKRDVELVHDFFTPAASLGSKGIFVEIKQ